jgi:peptidoglycan/LPS O-acetylase OafA/YrhL
LRDIFSFGGPAGVSFFFVLSGFIICRVHAEDFGHPERLRAYLGKRIRRIYPTYWIVFFAVYGLALATPSLRDTVPHDIPTLARSLLLLPQDVAVVGGTGAPVIVVAWSLQYEIVFYAAIAAAIVSARLFAALVVLFCVNFIAYRVVAQGGFPQAFFANPQILLFAMGMLVARYARAGAALRRPALLGALAALAMAGIGALQVVDAHASPEIRFDLAYGLASSALVLALVTIEDRAPAAFPHRAASLMGDSSYALYLVHFPLLALLCKAASAAGLSGRAGAVFAFVACVAGCCAFALAFHWYGEAPLLRRLAGARPPPRATGQDAPGVTNPSRTQPGPS